MLSRVLKVAAAASLAGAAACASPPPAEVIVPEEAPKPSISSSRQLVTEMHDRYAESWYRTLRFEQTNTFYTSSGQEQKSRWIENLSVPGKLRIDFEPLSSKSGLGGRAEMATKKPTPKSSTSDRSPSPHCRLRFASA